MSESAAASEPAATVIIVNYNGAHLLPDCLRGLEKQTDAPPFETVVVDNASADGSCELLARDFGWVRVIESPRNLGFAGGNNLALREVSTRYAVLLNNDAVPEPGWLATLLAAFEDPAAHTVGILTGKVLFMPKFVRMTLHTDPPLRPGPSDDRELGVRVYRLDVDGTDVADKVLWEKGGYAPEGGGEDRFRWTRANGQILIPIPQELCGEQQLRQPVKLSLSVRTDGSARTLSLTVGARRVDNRVTTELSELSVLLDAGTPVVDVINNAGSIVLRDGSGGDRGFQEIDAGQYDKPEPVFAACGNGMALRTAVGREIGWFDESFFMYYEDTDLSWRWQSRGWSIGYVPTAVLRHVHAATSKEYSPRWVFHVERNRLLMLTKNATGELAARAVLGYLRGVAAITGRAGRDALRQRRLAPLGVARLRGQVLRSYTAQAPQALRERAQLRRASVVPTRTLQQWLVKRR